MSTIDNGATTTMTPKMIEEWGDYLSKSSSDDPPLLYCQRSLSLLSRLFSYKKKFKKRNEFVSHLPRKMVDIAIKVLKEGEPIKQDNQQYTQPSSSSSITAHNLPALPSNLFNALMRMYFPNALTNNVVTVCIIAKEQLRLFESLTLHVPPSNLTHQSSSFLNAIVQTSKLSINDIPTVKNDKWIKCNRFFVKTALQIAKSITMDKKGGSQKHNHQTSTYPHLFDDLVGLLSTLLSLEQDFYKEFKNDITSEIKTSLPLMLVMDYMKDGEKRGSSESGSRVNVRNAVGLIKMMQVYLPTAGGMELRSVIKAIVGISNFCYKQIVHGELAGLPRLLAQELLRGMYNDDKGGKVIQELVLTLCFGMDSTFCRIVGTEVFANFVVSLNESMKKGFVAVALEVAARRETAPSERSWLLSSVDRVGGDCIPWDSQPIYEKLADIVEDDEGRDEERLALAKILGRFWARREKGGKRVKDFVFKELKAKMNESAWDEGKCVALLATLGILKGWAEEGKGFEGKEPIDKSGNSFEGAVVHCLHLIMGNILRLCWGEEGAEKTLISVKAKLVEGCLEVLTACGSRGWTAAQLTNIIDTLVWYFNGATTQSNPMSSSSGSSSSTGSEGEKKKKKKRKRNSFGGDGGILARGDDKEGFIRVVMRTLYFVDQFENIVQGVKWANGQDKSAENLRIKMRNLMAAILGLLDFSRDGDRLAVVKSLQTLKGMEKGHEVVVNLGLKERSVYQGYLKGESEKLAELIDQGREGLYEKASRHAIRSNANFGSKAGGVKMEHGAQVYSVDGVVVVVPEGKEDTKIALQVKKKGTVVGTIQGGGTIELKD